MMASELAKSLTKTISEKGDVEISVGKASELLENLIKLIAQFGDCPVSIGLTANYSQSTPFKK